MKLKEDQWIANNGKIITRWKPDKRYKAKERTEEEKQRLLENFDLIPEEEYGLIPTGSIIRYVKPDGKLCMGGVLKSNSFPKYWVLMNVVGGMSWSVQLQNGNKLYLLNKGKQKAIKEEQKQIWLKLKKGECMLLEIPEYKNLIKYETLYEKQKKNLKKIKDENRKYKDNIVFLKEEMDKLNEKYQLSIQKNKEMTNEITNYSTQFKEKEKQYTTLERQYNKVLDVLETKNNMLKESKKKFKQQSKFITQLELDLKSSQKDVQLLEKINKELIAKTQRTPLK